MIDRSLIPPNRDASEHIRDAIRSNECTARTRVDTSDHLSGRTPSHLPVAPERQSVMTLPGLSATSTGLVVAVALVETARALASGSEATGLAVLVDWINNPIDARILTDCLVLRIDQDDLIILIGRILVDPVRVQDAEVGTATTNTLLSGGLERTLILQLVDTLVRGLACCDKVISDSILCPKML